MTGTNSDLFEIHLHLGLIATHNTTLRTAGQNQWMYLASDKEMVLRYPISSKSQSYHHPGGIPSDLMNVHSRQGLDSHSIRRLLSLS